MWRRVVRACLVVLLAMAHLGLSDATPHDRSKTKRTRTITSHGSRARVPPMGFNTWNAYSAKIDEKLIKSIADNLVSTGLRDAGYVYLNLDDGWANSKRGADGAILPNPEKFPSGMKALGDYIHSKGLLYGIYTSENVETCQHLPGSYNHEMQDAAMYCEWGVDYLKLDHCGDGNHSWAYPGKSWILFRQGLDKCDKKRAGGHHHLSNGTRPKRRRMLLSVEFCTMDIAKCVPWFLSAGPRNDITNCKKWLRKARVDIWRTKSDIKPKWSSIMEGAECASLSRALSVDSSRSMRGFNDPDIMEIGHAGLSMTEQKAHFSIWCILAAPILLSLDLNQIKPETLAMLKNLEVIAVNQDPLAIQGRQVKCHSDHSGDSSSAWLKPLASHDAGRQLGPHGPTKYRRWALLLLNKGSRDATLSVKWAEININATKLHVRDLWELKDIGVQEGFSRKVKSHDVVLLTLRTVG